MKTPPPLLPPMNTTIQQPISSFYQKRMSSHEPGYVLFLIDQSSSMNARFGDSNASKAQECALAVNRCLAELINICTNDEFVISNRSFISALGYGQGINDIFKNNFGTSILTVSDLDEKPLRKDKVWVTYELTNGQKIQKERAMPIWIEPVSENGTPMAEAFARAKQYAETWVEKYPTHHPPIVINVTDGEPNSMENARNAAEELQQVSTTDGATLLFNIHISSTAATPLVFPNLEADFPDQYSKFLFSLSSPLTQANVACARQAEIPVSEVSRGFAYNADYDALISCLNLLSKSM